jgi:hypothetical protein
VLELPEVECQDSPSAVCSGFGRIELADKRYTLSNVLPASEFDADRPPAQAIDQRWNQPVRETDSKVGCNIQTSVALLVKSCMSISAPPFTLSNPPVARDTNHCTSSVMLTEERPFCHTPSLRRSRFLSKPPRRLPCLQPQAHWPGGSVTPGNAAMNAPKQTQRKVKKVNTRSYA